MEFTLPEKNHIFTIFGKDFNVWCNDIEAHTYLNIFTMLNTFGSKYLDKLEMTWKGDNYTYKRLEDIIPDSSICNHIRSNIYQYDRNVKIDSVLYE